MAVAIVLGVISGVVGFIPLVLALRATKHNPTTGLMAPMAKLILGLIISFVILFIAAVLYIAFDKGNAMPFALAEVLALSVSAIGFGIKSHKKK